MTDPEKYIEEDRISLQQLIERIVYWFRYCISQLKYILLAAVIGGLLGYTYTFKRPTYFAETTFALEESSGMGLSQIAGLASVAGINMGPLASGGNSIFEGENIMQLYTSQKMIESTLLNETESKGKKEKLLYTYAREKKLDKLWEKKAYLKDLSFDIPREEFTRHQDSILFKLCEEIRKNYLSVSKPSRRLNIISVKVSFKDPDFARQFNNALVKNVNEFYFETKTKKTAVNLQTLQTQADSIKSILDKYVTDLALAYEATPNPNVLLRTSRVPVHQRQIDVQSSVAAYAEILKSLEMAKLNHLSNTPLMQIIDEPNNYLDNDKWRWYKGIVIGAFLGTLLIITALTISLISKSALKQETG